MKTQAITARSSESEITLPGAQALPGEIQWMPPGPQTITATKGSEPFKMDVVVNAALAALVATHLQTFRAKAASGQEDLPYFDFNHEDGEASAHPTEFYWGGDDPKTGGIRAKLEWTKAGAQAVLGHTYHRFSPEFLVDEASRIVGVGLNMGGLVNRAAFKNIRPVMGKDGGAGGAGRVATGTLKQTDQNVRAALRSIGYNVVAQAVWQARYPASATGGRVTAQAASGLAPWDSTQPTTSRNHPFLERVTEIAKQTDTSLAEAWMAAIAELPGIWADYQSIEYQERIASLRT